MLQQILLKISSLNLVIYIANCKRDGVKCQLFNGFIEIEVYSSH